MGRSRDIRSELLIVAAFSRHAEALSWAQEALEQEFGPLAFTSLPYDFKQTRYYEDAMGTGLRKLFLAFARLVAPDQLAAMKVRTNELEAEAAASGKYPDARPLNLDPGLISLGKLVLATTKDQAHRIYLRDGIFAETTLRYQDGDFHPWPWTYADYRLPEVIAFFREAREFYRARSASKCYP